MLQLRAGAGQVTFSGYFSGERDDSTFLSDRFFGSSLLLPNRDLDPAYQKLDLSASCRGQHWATARYLLAGGSQLRLRRFSDERSPLPRSAMMSSGSRRNPIYVAARWQCRLWAQAAG